MKNEIWKPIKGFEGFYEISNYGRVKSVKRTIRSGKGYGKHEYGGRILKHSETNGYSRVTLCKGRLLSYFSVHRLVAEAFIPNPDNKPEIDHINTLRNDNRAVNLRWVTKIENARNPNTVKNRKNNHKNGSHKLVGELNKFSKPLIAINVKDGSTLRFSCLKDAYRQGFNLGHVSECANGTRTTHKGYEWFFEKEYNIYNNFCHVFEK